MQWAERAQLRPDLPTGMPCLSSALLAWYAVVQMDGLLSVHLHSCHVMYTGSLPSLPLLLLLPACSSCGPCMPFFSCAVIVAGGG